MLNDVKVMQLRCEGSVYQTGGGLEGVPFSNINVCSRQIKSSSQ